MRSQSVVLYYYLIFKKVRIIHIKKKTHTHTSRTAVASFIIIYIYIIHSLFHSNLKFSALEIYHLLLYNIQSLLDTNLLL
jgi:hypothetical protein